MADTLAGAAPFGEDLTVVVVGGGERQPVPYPLESIRRKAAFPALPMAFSVRQWSASAVVTFRPSGETLRQNFSAPAIPNPHSRPTGIPAPFPRNAAGAVWFG